MRRVSAFLWLAATLFTVSSAAVGGNANAAESGKTLVEDTPSGGFYIGPKYFFLKDQPYAGLFSQSGFDVPSQNRLGLDFGFYGTAPTGWRFGLDFSFFSAHQTPGAPDAIYQQLYFGLLFGKNLLTDSQWDLFLGSSLGWGGAMVEVLSPSINGRLTESSFYFEPSLLLAHSVTEHLKLGLQASYVYPIELSSEAKGQGLGLGRISGQGWAATFQFILGSWGHCSSCGRATVERD